MRLSPSAAARWVPCPGSAAIPQLTQQSKGYPAVWGTAAHKLLEICLREGEEPLGYVGQLWPVDPNVADDPNIVRIDGKPHVVVSAEMANHVLAALDAVRQLGEAYGTPPAGWYIEEHLIANEYVQGIADVFGVVGDVVIVLDLKTGRTEVEVDDNPQLLIYAYAALRRAPEAKRVVLCIVQPASLTEVVKAIELDAAEVEAYWQQTIAPAVARAVEAAKADELGPYLHPGKHCRFCPFAASCSVLSKHVTSWSADAATLFMDDGALVALFRKLTEARWLHDTVRDEIRRRIQEKGPIDGVTLVYRNGTRKWKPHAEAVLVDCLGKDAYVHELISPAQLEKRFPEYAQLATSDDLVETTAAEAYVRLTDSPKPATNRAAGLVRKLGEMK